MIAISLDLNYLSKYLNISAERLRLYRSKSLQEIVEAEAAQGNAKAQEYLLSVLQDPEAILRLFKLGNARNRWKILREMNKDDLSYMLQFLETKDLVNGLKFFTQDALMKAIRQMPKKEIVKIVFECYGKKEFLQLVPNAELNKWFESEKVDKKKVKELLKTMPQEALAQMVEAVKGESQEEADRASLLQTINGFNPDQFMDGIKSLKPKFKQHIILQMTQEDPKLWEEFSVKALTKPLELLDKPELIKGMAKLEDEMLAKVVDNLPQDLLSMVVAQIDPEVFANLLSTKYQDLLQQVVSM